jgi:hypothetical protein
MSVLDKNKVLPVVNRKKQLKPSILPEINTVMNRTTSKPAEFGAPLPLPAQLPTISDDNDNGKNKATPHEVSPTLSSTTAPLFTFKKALRAFEFLAICVILILLSIFFHDWLTSGATSSSSGGACVPKCTLSSDITPIQFLTGVTNVTYVCYRGSSQVIYTPPTDPLNFDFSTSSYNAALTVCQKSVKQSFTAQPSFIPYMANDPTGQANGVYTRCSLVWECSFSYFT